jgi:hypothetical protein
LLNLLYYENLIYLYIKKIIKLNFKIKSPQNVF